MQLAWFTAPTHVAGALLLGGAVAGLAWSDVAIVLGFSFVADIAVNHVACRLHLRDTTW